MDIERMGAIAGMFIIGPIMVQAECAHTPIIKYGSMPLYPPLKIVNLN